MIYEKRLFHVVGLAAAVLWLGACARSQGVVTAPEPAADVVHSLFDGRTLGQWKISNFAGGGEVYVDEGQIIIEQGYDLSGITWQGDVVRMNYEISLEVRRIAGQDFFCGLTFAVNDAPCSLIVGGWGGSLVGLSSLDGFDAANNTTTTFARFENDRWYAIRLRVTPKRIQAWIDDERVIDLDATLYQYGIRREVEPSVPLGIATYQTMAAVRKIEVRELGEGEER